MSLDVIRRAPLGVASVVIAGAVYVYLVWCFGEALSSGYSIGEAITAAARTLLPLNGSLVLAPVLISLPLGIVSLVRRERPRWGLWGVILSVVLLVTAAVVLALYIGLLVSALTQNW